MADVDAINHGDVATVEKRCCGFPCGSKNKTKSYLVVVVSSSTPAKRCPRCTLGSKNKKSAVVTTDPADRLDVSFVHPFASLSSSGDLFSFFLFR
jgi:hypothetical protein